MTKPFTNETLGKVIDRLRALADELNEIQEEALKVEPLFTTADGVLVFADDKVYRFSWHGKDEHEHEMLAQLANQDHIWYSTPEAAQSAFKEWLYSQPVLSINDLPVGLPDGFYSHLVGLAQQKLFFK